MKIIYRFLSAIQHPFLLLLRLYWGFSFFQTGWGKFHNMSNVVEFFTSLGIPFPQYNATLVASVETVGGLCLLFGLFARLVSVPLAINMIVALLTAHSKETFNLFQDPNAFLAEEPILFLNAALIIMLFGPGLFSLDALRCWIKNRVAK